VGITDQQALRRPAQETRAKAESGSGWYAVVARVGLVAKGVSYGLVGVLAIGVATGGSGKTTSRNGALETLAHHGWGKIALVSVGTMVAFFLMFEVWFKVPLPKGPLEAAFGFA